MTELRDALTHPLTTVSAAVGLGSLVGSLPIVGPLSAFVWANAAQLFTFATLLEAGPLAESLPIPSETVTTAVLIVGVIYAAKLANRLTDDLEDQFDT